MSFPLDKQHSQDFSSPGPALTRMWPLRHNLVPQYFLLQLVPSLSSMPLISSHHPLTCHFKSKWQDSTQRDNSALLLGPIDSKGTQPVLPHS